MMVPYGQDISRETGFVVIMAVLVLTPEQELELGSPDLRFLLERQGVEAVHRASFSNQASTPWISFLHLQLGSRIYFRS